MSLTVCSQVAGGGMANNEGHMVDLDIGSFWEISENMANEGIEQEGAENHRWDWR